MTGLAPSLGLLCVSRPLISLLPLPPFSVAYAVRSYTNLAIADSFISGALSGTTVRGDASSLSNTATITNSGTVSGPEVAQRYIRLPAKAPSSLIRQLRRFEKVSIQAGQSVTVSFLLRTKDLVYWGPMGKAWTLPKVVFILVLGRVLGILG
jgi:beta-glucosidase